MGRAVGLAASLGVLGKGWRRVTTVGRVVRFCLLLRRWRMTMMMMMTMMIRRQRSPT